MSFVRSLVTASLLACSATTVAAQQSIRPVTLARLDQFIKGLEAEKAFWSPVWERDRRTVDSVEKSRPQMPSDDPFAFEKRRDEHRACQERVISRDPEATGLTKQIEAAMKKMTPAEQQQFFAAAGPLMQRREQAEKQGDDATLATLDEQLSVQYAKFLGINAASFTRTMKRAGAASLKECGKAPVPLTREQQDSARNAAQNQNAEWSLVSDTLTSDVGARVSGLGENYPLLRELITMYIASEENGGAPTTEGGFTAAERAVIKQRLARIKPLLEFLDRRGALGS